MRCKEPDCERRAVARGMCLMHYKRWWREHRDEAYDWKQSETDRFWQYVDKSGPNGCWNWTGLTLHGYGRFTIGNRPEDNRRQVQAHRYSYELLAAPIPEGYQIDHLCNNRRCVNPQHLEVVTPQTNTLRGNGVSARNARKTHCPHGHPYTEENTILDKRGNRKCKACRDLRYRRWKVAYNED